MFNDSSDVSKIEALMVQKKTSTEVFSHATAVTPITFFWTKKDMTNIFDGRSYLISDTFQKYMGNAFPNLVANKQANLKTIIDMVANGSADFSFDEFYLTEGRHKIVDFVTPILQAPLCIATRKAPNIPFGLVLLRPFNLLIWGGIVGSLLIAAFVWLCLCHYSSDDRLITVQLNGRKWHLIGRSLFDIYALALCGKRSCRARTAAQYALVAAILLFMLVLCNAYTGVLLGFLAAAQRYPDPETLIEAERILRRIYLYGDFRVLSDSNSEILRKIGTKLHMETHFEWNTRLLRQTTQRDEGFLMQHLVYRMISRYTKQTIDGKQVLQEVSECVFTPGYCGFIVRKKLPLFEVLNLYVLHVSQAGLYDHWVVAQRHRMTAHGLLLPEGESREPQPLGMAQLEGLFMLLALSLGAAATAFVAELLSVRCRRRR
ncbi:hypothetical protein R5R35_012238 [Gryllus longicercus]